MSPDYYISEFTIVDFGVVDLTFEDGLAGRVDLRARLWGPVFERVRTPEGFAEAFLENGTISWPGGADVAPDTLYEVVRTGAWPEALRA